MLRGFFLVSQHASRWVGPFVLVAGCAAGDILAPNGPSTVDIGGDGSNNGAGPGPSGGPNGQNVSFTCDADATPKVQELRRLSRAQYRNTLRDLLTWRVGATRAESALASVQTQLNAHPTDTTTKDHPFARMDAVVSQAHVDNFYAIGEGIARTLTADSASVAALLGSCSGATGNAANTCIDGFIRDFGERALRRPLSSDEIAFYRDLYGTPGTIDGRALRDVVTVLLNAPQLVYQLEDHGKDTAKPGVVALSGYELASRLSYHFLESSPDEALLAAAADGSLAKEDVFAEQVSRLLASPRAKETVRSFMYEWFDLGNMRELNGNNDDPVFSSFAGMDPSAELREAMIDDVTNSFVHHAFELGDGMKGFMNSQYAFTKSEELASIYKTAKWDGTSEPPQFPKGERAGLITRAALLSTGTANTRPIMKGVFIRTRLLCDTIAAPPPNVANVPPKLSDELSTREVVEQLTEQGSCASCHSTQINGLGFATENFDSLGRHRQEQKLFDNEGALVGEADIDTQSIPRVWPTDAEPVTDAIELTSRLIESGKLEACFARQYVRFALGRKEDLRADGCALEDARKALANDGSFEESLASIALRPEFKLRNEGEP
jgi:hypothetical protein